MSREAGRKIIVLDVETTGLDPEKDRICEIATVQIIERDGLWGFGERRCSLVNPGCPIPPEASGVHHIVDEDVAASPFLETAIENVVGGDADIFAAHNCRFDRSFLPMFHGQKWLDTYRCAMHIWPDAPNFQLSTLRYWLRLDVPRGRAHEATLDALVAAQLVIRLLEERGLDELLKLSTKACVLRKVGFGKHFGELWGHVPQGYLEWVTKQSDMDPDVLFTARHLLRKGS